MLIRSDASHSRPPTPLCSQTVKNKTDLAVLLQNGADSRSPRRFFIGLPINGGKLHSLLNDKSATCSPPPTIRRPCGACWTADEGHAHRWRKSPWGMEVSFPFKTLPIHFPPPPPVRQPSPAPPWRPALTTCRPPTTPAGWEEERRLWAGIKEGSAWLEGPWAPGVRPLF